MQENEYPSREEEVDDSILIGAGPGSQLPQVFLNVLGKWHPQLDPELLQQVQCAGDLGLRPCIQGVNEISNRASTVRSLEVLDLPHAVIITILLYGVKDADHHAVAAPAWVGCYAGSPPYLMVRRNMSTSRMPSSKIGSS